MLQQAASYSWLLTWNGLALPLFADGKCQQLNVGGKVRCLNGNCCYNGAVGSFEVNW